MSCLKYVHRKNVAVPSSFAYNTQAVYLNSLEHKYEELFTVDWLSTGTNSSALLILARRRAVMASLMTWLVTLSYLWELRQRSRTGPSATCPSASGGTKTLSSSSSSIHFSDTVFWFNSNFAPKFRPIVFGAFLPQIDDQITGSTFYWTTTKKRKFRRSSSSSSLLL